MGQESDTKPRDDSSLRLLTRPGLLFFGLSFLFYSPVLFGQIFLPTGYLSLNSLWYDPSQNPGNVDMFDAVVYYYPLDTFLRSELLQGCFPFWNPHNLAGHPVAFNGQSGFFYPIKLLLLAVFPAWVAHSLSLWFHTGLAGFGSCLLAKELGLSERASLFFGIAWMFNGFLSVWLQLGFITTCAALLPICLLFALRSLDRPIYIPAFSAVLAMLLVSAHLQFVVYFLIFGLAVGLLAGRPWSLNRAGTVLFGVAGGGALAAPYLLPSIVLMLSSQRPERSPEHLMDNYAQFFASAPGTLVFPDLFGNPASLFALARIQGSGNFIFSETCLYLGIVPLWLAFVSVGHRLGRLYFGAAILTFVLPATPLYLVLLQTVPGLDRLGSVRFVGLVHLFLILAAAYGLESVLNRPNSRTMDWAWAGIFALGCLAWWQGMTLKAQGWQRLMGSSELRLPTPDLAYNREEFVLLLKEGFEFCYSWQNPNLFGPVLILIGLTVFVFSKRSRFWIWFLIGATLLDLVLFSYRFNPPSSRTLLFPTRPELSYLQEHAALSRVAGLGTVKPNTLLPFTLNDAGGYDSFYPKDSNLFYSALLGLPPGRRLGQQVFLGERLNPRLLDLLGVQYLIGRPGGLNPGGERIESGVLPLFRRETALPKCYLVSSYEVIANDEEVLTRLKDSDFTIRDSVVLNRDPGVNLEGATEAGASLKIESFRPNRVDLQVVSPQPQILVLNDAWSPGWRAQINGKPVEIYRANQMFRAVSLESGDSQVTFRFIPPFWRLSWILFGLMLLVLSITLWVQLRTGPVGKGVPTKVP